MKKKPLLISTMTALAITALGACGGSNPYKSRPESFTFSYRKSGYGEWGKALAQYYMDNVNENVYVDVSYFENSESVRTQIQNKAPGLSDLYQIEVDLSNGSNFLCELTDIYESESPDGSGVIKDKIDETQLKVYNEKTKNSDGTYTDHYYRMPETMANGWRWVYNKTTLDSALGAGTWTLPRTTNEFFSLFERILGSRKAYPLVFCGNGGISGEYIRYINEAMFAQMMGYENYSDFFNGYYTSESGEKTFALTSPEFITSNRYAIEKTYEYVYKLFDTNNYYVHPDSDSFNYKQVNQAIYNGKISGYGTKLEQPPVFAATGSWIESEISEEIEYGFIDPSSQEIYSMKTPVMSEITYRCETINSDTTLCDVIDYVDGKSLTKPSGVSDSDIEIIREARNFVPELICRDFAIPTTTKKESLAKDFLKWLTTVEAQKVVSKYTKGANILPYGYVPTDEDMGFEISPLLKSFYDNAKDAILLDESGLNVPFRKHINANWLNTQNSTCANFPLNIFNGYANKPASYNGGTDNVTWFYNSLYGQDGSTYSSIMKTFKNLYPDYVDDWGNI